METTVRPFGWRDKIGYALGDFGCNMSFAFINSYMMLFFVTCLGILPQHNAVIIINTKVWDAINDPIIGGICDISHPRGSSKFKPWIKWASLPLLAASVLMFLYVPNAPYGVRVALCLGTYMIWSVAYTSVNVPYGSLQSVITKDRLQRVELSNYRSIGAMLAQAPVLILLPMLVYDDNDNPRGELFIYIVAIMGVIGLVSFQLLCRLVTERVYLEFLGANALCRVYANGKEVCEHRGGFSTFRCDVTDYIHFGKVKISVLTDNGENQEIYPQNADFTFFGGLYRDVRVITVPETHFDLDYSGTPGVAVTPNVLDDGSADIVLNAYISGDKAGKTVRFTVDGQTAEVPAENPTATIKLQNPHLWNGRIDPYLYTVKAELLENGEAMDCVEQRFGVRTFRVDPDKGFFLNGKPYPLHGVFEETARRYGKHRRRGLAKNFEILNLHFKMPDNLSGIFLLFSAEKHRKKLA